MAWNEAVITNDGIKLLSECVSDGNVIITRAEGGEQYSDPLSLITQKEISVPRHLLNIAYIRTDKGSITVNVRIQNSSVETPYSIKQIGLFAKSNKSEEEILFALIQDKDGEVIPTVEENPEYLSEFDFVIPVSNTENISINVTPNTFATLDDINEFTTHLKDNGRHITAEERSAWNGKAAGNHTHLAVTQSAAGFMSANDKEKLDGVEAGANAYTHPSTSGNKHIPSGGSSGQILRWSADGTAVWGTDNNNTYSAMTGATASAAGTAGLVPAPAKGKQTSFLRGDGTWVIPTNTTYVAMTGATASAAGTAGLVPAPAKGNQAKYLRGDGTWQTPPDTDTTYSAATQSAAGLMSAEDKKKLDGVATEANNYTHPSTSGNKHIPTGGASGQILRWSADGTAVWGADNNTTYSAMTGASASAAGTAGLVPAPAKGAQNYVLRGSGAWGPYIGITRIVEASLSESTSSSKFSTTVPSDASYFQVIIAAVIDASNNVSYALISPLLSCANGTRYKIDSNRIVGSSYGLLYVARSGKKEKASYADIEVKSGSLTVSGSYQDYTTPIDGYPIIGSGTISVYFYN